MSSPETDLLTGVAQLLADAGVGVYSTAGAYAADDVGIMFGDFTQDPSQQIVLTTYTVQDDPALNDSTVGLQVMLRGTADARSVKDRSGLIFDQLQGLTSRWFGQMFVALMWRQSGRLDGKDENNRWITSENYYARCNWPTQFRTE